MKIFDHGWRRRYRNPTFGGSTNGSDLDPWALFNCALLGGRRTLYGLESGLCVPKSTPRLEIDFSHNFISFEFQFQKGLYFIVVEVSCVQLN